MNEKDKITGFIKINYKVLILLLFIMVIGFQFMINKTINNINTRRTIKHYEQIIDSLNVGKLKHLDNINVLQNVIVEYKDSIVYFKRNLKLISNEKEIIRYTYFSNDSVVITFNDYISKYKQIR